jgi:hypothetical protein
VHRAYLTRQSLTALLVLLQLLLLLRLPQPHVVLLLPLLLWRLLLLLRPGQSLICPFVHMECCLQTGPQWKQGRVRTPPHELAVQLL